MLEKNEKKRREQTRKTNSLNSVLVLDLRRDGLELGGVARNEENLEFAARELKRERLADAVCKRRVRCERDEGKELRNEAHLSRR